MTPQKKKYFVPLLVALGIVFGIFWGTFNAYRFSGNRLSIINNSSNKVFDLFHLIDDQYVDSVQISDLVKRALPQILKELDSIQPIFQQLKYRRKHAGLERKLFRNWCAIYHL